MWGRIDGKREIGGKRGKGRGGGRGVGKGIGGRGTKG